MDKLVSNMPIKVKKILLVAYKKAINKGVSKKKALSLALKAVSNIYAKKGSKWVTKKSVKVQSVVKKSGLFNPSYSFTVPITDAWRDKDGDYVDISLLRKLNDNPDMIDKIGDIHHFKLNGNTEFNGLVHLINHSYKDGALYGKFVFNKKHSMYKAVIDKIKHNPNIGISAEFYNEVRDGHKIVDCDSLGWTVDFASELRNPRSIVVG